MKLYKYRDTANIKFLLDIFLNNRLYAATYREMNDPMEGHYLYRSGKLNPEFKAALRGEKDRYGICSLSEDPCNRLLWDQYADGHKGVAIGVTVTDPGSDTRKMKYTGLNEFANRRSHQPDEVAIQVLSHKLEIWDYEKEHRAFVKHKAYIDVKVHEVIFGRRVEQQEKDFLTKMIRAISPDVKVKDELNI